MVDVAVDAAFVRVAGNAGEEGVTDFVYLSGTGDLLGDRMLMRREEIFGEGRHSRGSTGVGDAQLVEDDGDGRRRP